MVGGLVIAFAVLVGLSLVVSVVRTGVPALSSSRLETDAVVALLAGVKLPERAVIMDLGSGWGSQ
jgi:hypothetical protein